MSNFASSLVDMIVSSVRNGGDDVRPTGCISRVDSEKERARDKIRNDVGAPFENCSSATVVVATTDSGSTYEVRLTACSLSNVIRCTDSTTGHPITYSCRPCTVIINGEVYRNVVAGFDRGTRTILVGDTATTRRVARSSTVRSFTAR